MDKENRIKKAKIYSKSIVLLAIVTLISIFCSSCGIRLTAPKKLTTPNVTLTGNTVSWTVDENADKYEINVDGNISYVDSSITQKTLSVGETFKIRAVGDGIKYVSSDWSASVKYENKNIITTGTLDVKLTQKDANGNYTEVDGPVFDNVLWEPNATYVEYFRIENTGVLPIKFTIAFDVTNVTKDLNEVLEYAVVEGTSLTSWNGGTAVAVGNNVTAIDGITLAPAGEENCYYDFALAVHMNHNAGNKYQQAKITIELRAQVTQIS